MINQRADGDPRIVRLIAYSIYAIIYLGASFMRFT